MVHTQSAKTERPLVDMSKEGQTVINKDLFIVPATRSTNLANTDALEDRKEVIEEENIAEVMDKEDM